MDNTDRNKQIVDYLNGRMDEIDSKYPEIDVRSRATKALDEILQSEGSYEEVKSKLDKSLDKMIQVHLEKEQAKKEEEINSRKKFDNDMSKIKTYVPKEKLYGETYKTPMIDVFLKYEEYKDNPERFNEELKTLINILRQKYKALISSQIKDDIMRGELNGYKEDPLLYYMSELFRGFDSLNYDLVKKMYDTFEKDLSAVSSDFDNNMKFCINGNEALYLTQNDSYYSNFAYFDFSRLVYVFRFFKKHGKKIRLHSLLSNEYVPEALISNTKKLEGNKKTEYVLAFLDDYVSSLSKIMTENGIEIDQIDVCDGFNSSEKNYWKDCLSSTQEQYYVLILKIVRKYFPNAVLIINEKNELVDYVFNDFVSMINNIIEVEKKENIKLINAIGISSHITEFIDYYGRELKGKDIYDSMSKLSTFNLPIFRTEFDIKCMGNSASSKNDIINLLSYVDVKCGVEGLILCGNNDIITNKEGEFNKVHVYDDSSIMKDIYSDYVGLFMNKSEADTNQPEVLTFNEKDDKAENVVKWSSGDIEDANTSGSSTTSEPTVIRYSTDEKGFTSSIYALVVIMIILLAFVIFALLIAF